MQLFVLHEKARAAGKVLACLSLGLATWTIGMGCWRFFRMQSLLQRNKCVVSTPLNMTLVTLFITVSFLSFFLSRRVFYALVQLKACLTRSCL